MQLFPNYGDAEKQNKIYTRARAEMIQKWCSRLRHAAALYSVPKPHHHRHSIISGRLLHTSPNFLHKPHISSHSIISPNFKLPLNAPPFPQLVDPSAAYHCQAEEKEVKESFKGRFRVMNDGKIRRWKEEKRHNAFSKVCATTLIGKVPLYDPTSIERLVIWRIIERDPRILFRLPSIRTLLIEFPIAGLVLVTRAVVVVFVRDKRAHICRAVEHGGRWVDHSFVDFEHILAARLEVDHVKIVVEREATYAEVVCVVVGEHDCFSLVLGLRVGPARNVGHEGCGSSHEEEEDGQVHGGACLRSLQTSRGFARGKLLVKVPNLQPNDRLKKSGPIVAAREIRML
ncbi:50S ribosomal protein L35 [Striga asiatica]|uniref:50S ribosomal protein L35 n=1 Tax=Striga asiatica TaxID=4170 RepID=A0A5A7P241_STRAF|nr:50S ribosomal protein L35 [Striga asiatica]